MSKTFKKNKYKRQSTNRNITPYLREKFDKHYAITDTLHCHYLLLLRRFIISDLRSNNLVLVGTDNAESDYAFLKELLTSTYLENLIRAHFDSEYAGSSSSYYSSLYAKYGELVDFVNTIFETELDPYRVGLYKEDQTHCGAPVILSENTYNKGSVCTCSKCGTSVSTYPFTNIPMGTFVDKETARLRIMTHIELDSLWDNPYERKQVYAILAANMGLPLEDTHVSKFDKEQCMEALEISAKLKEEHRAKKLLSLCKNVNSKQ